MGPRDAMRRPWHKQSVLVRRRGFFQAAFSASVLGMGGAAEASGAFVVKRLTVKGKHASRFDLLVPRHLGKDDRVRLLVALHGLGESHDAELGAAAWVDRYGLGTSYDRLLAPPIARTSKRGEWTDERLKAVNVALHSRPFPGIAVACPYTPNFKEVPDRAGALKEYGAWIVDKVIPMARKEAPCRSDAASTSIDGCSMGGPFAIEIFIAHADSFGALGGVQAAFGAQRAAGYAEKISDAMARHGARPVSMISSEGDKFRDSAKALGAELSKKKVANTVRILPGPHDQPWLREAGTIEMLLFHATR